MWWLLAYLTTSLIAVWLVGREILKSQDFIVGHLTLIIVAFIPIFGILAAIWLYIPDISDVVLIKRKDK